MQKLSLILPKLIVPKINMDAIKNCIIDNWDKIIPIDIIALIKFNKLLLTKNFQLKICIDILSCSIIIVKMHESEIISNIKKFTKMENIYINYKQLLILNNEITKN